MKTLQELIASYHAISADPNREQWDKIQILEELEAHFDNSAVQDLVLAVLGDTEEYEPARIHLLKWFECCPAFGTAMHHRIGGCIASTLRIESVWVMRAWLARVVCMSHHVEAILDVASERLLDRSDNLDVRLGCLAALRFAGPKERVIQVFQELCHDTDEIGEDVRQNLARWGVPAEEAQ